MSPLAPQKLLEPVRRPLFWALWHHRSSWSLWEGLHYEPFATTGALGACEKAFTMSPLAPQELLEPVRRPSLWALWHHCVFAHRKIIEALSNTSYKEVCKWSSADNDCGKSFAVKFQVIIFLFLFPFHNYSFCIHAWLAWFHKLANHVKEL